MILISSHLGHSVLVGPCAFIRKARHFRKLFGAGIRQSGGLAAAARVAVVQHFPKLRATHELARFAAKGIQELGVEITSGAETSMVSFMSSCCSRCWGSVLNAPH